LLLRWPVSCPSADCAFLAKADFIVILNHDIYVGVKNLKHGWKQ
jgi:hypothetical protein